jgi:hypothetical protein
MSEFEADISTPRPKTAQAHSPIRHVLVPARLCPARPVPNCPAIECDGGSPAMRACRLTSIDSDRGQDHRTSQPSALCSLLFDLCSLLFARIGHDATKSARFDPRGERTTGSSRAEANVHFECYLESMGFSVFLCGGCGSDWTLVWAAPRSYQCPNCGWSARRQLSRPALAKIIVAGQAGLVSATW